MRIGDIGIGRELYDAKSNTVFYIAAQNHYGINITTLLTKYIIGVRALDAAEDEYDIAKRDIKNVYEKTAKYGNNHYAYSNLHQWLNSQDENWYRKMHKNDMPPVRTHLFWQEHPYDNKPGFLFRFSDDLKNNLVVTRVPLIERVRKGEGKLTGVDAAVFLPSRTEMNKGNEGGIEEGCPLPIFYDHYIFKAKPSPDQMKKYGRSWNPELPEEHQFFDGPQMYDPKFGWWYYMRTPSVMYSFMQRVMTAYGSVSYTYANNDVVGIRPLLNVDADLEVADVGSEKPYYRIGK